MAAQSNIEFGKEFSEQLTVHKNLGQEVVVTTVDKVRICLMQNQTHLRGQREWITPLSLLVAIVTTLVAADFKDAGLKRDVWQAIYVIAALLCTAWFALSCVRAWQHRKRGSIDGIVGELKASGLPVPPAAG